MNEEITLERIDELLAFLPQFVRSRENWITEWGGGKTLPDGAMTMLYPVYSDEVRRFIELASQDCWMDYGYVPSEAGEMFLNDEIVRSATLEQFRTMLTWFVRGERFCDGHWNGMIQNGRLGLLLQRLRTLREEM